MYSAFATVSGRSKCFAHTKLSPCMTAQSQGKTWTCNIRQPSADFVRRTYEEQFSIGIHGVCSHYVQRYAYMETRLYPEEKGRGPTISMWISEKAVFDTSICKTGERTWLWIFDEKHAMHSWHHQLISVVMLCQTNLCEINFLVALFSGCERLCILSNTCLRREEGLLVWGIGPSAVICTSTNNFWPVMEVWVALISGHSFCASLIAVNDTLLMQK